MEDISSPDSITPVPSPPNNNPHHQMAMPESKAFDVEKAVAENGNNQRRQSVVEVVADPNDDLDPQNWKPWKKRLVFIALMSSSILCDGYLASLFERYDDADCCR